MNTCKLIKLFLGLSAVLLPLHSGAQFSVNLKAYLEGPFNEFGSMDNSLFQQNLIPLSQPYNVSPWNYDGPEQVSYFASPAIVDWVLVEIRETPGDPATAGPETSIAKQAGFVLTNGTITSIYNSPMQFNIPWSSNLYVVIYHRNHLAVMSSFPMNWVGFNWDFTAGAGQALGGATGHKELLPGVWGMVSGDGNASSQISSADITTVWSPPAGSHGYFMADFNMDGEVNNQDKDNYWIVNVNSASQVLLPWACNMPITDSRDSRVYNTIQIGDQCWMAQNLDYGNMVDSTIISSNNGVPEKYCFHDNENSCSEYGALYSWNELMQYSGAEGSQGMCPDGWHVPAREEYFGMIDFVGGESLAGKKLKEKGTEHWNEPNSASNSSGFTGLGSGWGDSYWDYSFSDLKYSSMYWTSTISPDPQSSYDIYLGTDVGYGEVVISYHWFDYRYSARCLKDAAPAPWGCGDTLVDPRNNEKYGTVQIGSQCWMTQDLNIGTMITGGSPMTNNGVIEKYCYSDFPASCDSWGALYTWEEVMEYSATPGVQGICPDGWHVPMDDEWGTLIDYLGGDYAADEKLKEAGTDHWWAPNTGATNESGFTSWGSGRWDGTSNLFMYQGGEVQYWTSTNYYYRYMFYNISYVGHFSTNGPYAWSVRCMRY